MKKWFLWSLYAAFVGILLAGAAYRTSIKWDNGREEQNRRQESNGQSPFLSSEDVPLAGRTTSGLVVEIAKPGLTLQLSTGETIRITGRAWRYAQNLGFEARSGDILWLKGASENDHFEVFQITNLRTQQIVDLRDETGQPLWQGQ